MLRLKLPSFRSFFFLLPLLAASVAPAQDVHTEPPADDANYVLQGEFVGELTKADGTKETIAVQLRPVGGDKFEGLVYSGGLPGEPGHQPEGTHLVGLRAGDKVLLSGTELAMFLDAEKCVVISSEGQVLGSLARVIRSSPTLGAAAPEGAIAVFDGSGTENLLNGNMNDAGLLMIGADLKPLVQDFDLHLEFKLPYMPNETSQQRGNSGIYIHSRYECQILDSFAELPVFNGCGSLYRFKSPDLNMCFPPLIWQTYDIRFTAARWAADGTKVRNAHITSWLNGVVIQDDVELPNKTGRGQEESATVLPTKFQDHEDPVHFRNIWVVDRGISGSANFPPIAQPVQ